jgi:hypothetical protein
MIVKLRHFRHAITLVGLLLATSAAAQAVDPPPEPPKPEPAQAEAGWADYQNCDGYGPITRVGDGMTEQATGWFVAGGDRVRRTPSFRDGVGACTRALAGLDAVAPDAWQRRVSLLQARAAHRLDSRDAPGALADLDLADQAAVDRTDPYYFRSLGINTDMVRAFALAQNGDTAAGEALAMTAWARRPFSREVTTAAILVVGPKGNVENVDRLVRGASRLDPSLSGMVFRYHFESGRFDTALAAFDEVVAPVPIQDQTFDLRANLERAEQQRARDEIFWLDMAARRAYALAALGRNDEARTVWAAARTRLEGATPAPDPLPARPSNRDRILNVAREQANLQIQTSATPLRDGWDGLIQARLAANEGRTAEGNAIFQALDRLPPSYAVVDLMAALNASAADIEQISQSLPGARFGFPSGNVRTVFGWLLDAETQTRAASGMASLDALFASRSARDRGGCTERRQDDGTVNLCYKGLQATLAVTEERALLRAAARAAENGGRFRIERRDDIQHSIVSTMYGVPMSESQAGFESSLFIRFIPADQTCDRCLNAADVQAALADVYAQATASSR